MESHIRIAAFSAVNSLCNSLGVVAYWPNVSVIDDIANEHILVDVINTEPTQTNICNGEAVHKWILQLTVAVRDGVGEIRPSQLADSLKNGLPFGAELTGGGHSFRISKTADIKSAQSLDGWLYMPAQFRLETIG